MEDKQDTNLRTTMIVKAALKNPTVIATSSSTKIQEVTEQQLKGKLEAHLTTNNHIVFIVRGKALGEGGFVAEKMHMIKCHMSLGP